MTHLTLKNIFGYLSATPDSRCFVEGEQILNSKHIVLCGKASGRGADNPQIIALCLQTSALQQDPHRISGQFFVGHEEVRVEKMSCSCKAGLSGRCKHISATLLFCSRTSIEDLETISSTDVECYWKGAKSTAKKKYEPIPICEFPCLATKIKNRKRVLPFLEDELNDSKMKLLSAAGNDAALNLHIRGRRNVECEEGVSFPPADNEDMNAIQVILDNSRESSFLESCNIQIFPLFECCTTKWEIINKVTEWEAASSTQGSEKWLCCRRFRLSGSNCYGIFTYRGLNWQTKAKTTFFPKAFTNSQMEYGKREEGNAKKAYEEDRGVAVCNIGFVICRKFPWLGYSPDGVVIENGKPSTLIEIKCPQLGKENNINMLKSCTFLKTINNVTSLKKKHMYYGQVQLGMSLLNLSSCDFLVYSSMEKKNLILKIPFDADFAQELITTITRKYFYQMLPFLCGNHNN